MSSKKHCYFTNSPHGETTNEKAREQSGLITLWNLHTGLISHQGTQRRAKQLKLRKNFGYQFLIASFLFAPFVNLATNYFMKILISTYGARGDIAPYVSVARALKNLGARPTVATASVWQDLVESAGIEWAFCPPDAPADAALTRVMHGARGDERLFREWIVPALRESYNCLDELAHDADVLVTHTLSFAGPLVAQKRGLPWVSSAVSPLALLEPQLSPALPVAPWAADYPGFNRLLLRLLRRQFGMWLRPVQDLRRDLGLPPGDNAIWHDAHSPLLALRLWPEQFCAAGTQGRAQTVGFCFAAPGHLPGDIEVWLDAGEAPMLFCAASGCGGAQWEARAQQSARKLGKRALILGAGADSESAEVLARRFAPLDAIAPRAAAVIHGGGIGALAIAWRAGVPMLLAPRAHDQADNARRARKLGVAHIARGDWSGAVAALLADADLRARVEQTGALIARADGARAAASAILESAA